MLIWIKNIVVFLLSLFFLDFGINILMGSFKMNNPLEFVMTFFSASFIFCFALSASFMFFSAFSRRNLIMRWIMMTRNKFILLLITLIIIALFR